MDNEAACVSSSVTSSPSPRFWGGLPDGEECDVCEAVVRADQLLMEGISTETNQGLQFHVECFYIFHVECFYISDSERDVLGRAMDIAAGE
jgi:hypothetical protein